MIDLNVKACITFVRGDGLFQWSCNVKPLRFAARNKMTFLFGLRRNKKCETRHLILLVLNRHLTTTVCIVRYVKMERKKTFFRLKIPGSSKQKNGKPVFFAFKPSLVQEPDFSEGPKDARKQTIIFFFKYKTGSYLAEQYRLPECWSQKVA